MIYVLEDDPSIRELLCYTLNAAGMSAQGYARPSEFFAAVRECVPSLCILDIMLPEQDGLSVLQKLREDNSTKNVMIMMLTAKSTEYDKVVGLEGGADDYVTKPFGMMELCSRVRALLRRANTTEEPSELKFGSLIVNTLSRTVISDGQNVNLTYKEFELLVMLIQNKDIVCSRDNLLNKVWGYSFDGESRTVDVHIRSLRQKLGSAMNMIETVRGAGYKFTGKQND